MYSFVWFLYNINLTQAFISNNLVKLTIKGKKLNILQNKIISQKYKIEVFKLFKFFI